MPGYRWTVAKTVRVHRARPGRCRPWRSAGCPQSWADARRGHRRGALLLADRQGRFSVDPEIYRGRNVVERCFNKLKNWRGIAMRSDKTARSYHAAICLAATLVWIRSDLVNTS
jgi:transposase